jgi:hypothetical protein
VSFVVSCPLALYLTLARLDYPSLQYQTYCSFCACQDPTPDTMFRWMTEKTQTNYNVLRFI